MVTLVAHRGASAEAPENTLLSVQRAIDLGADAIELDIQLTADDVPIAFHNSTLQHTYGIDRAIASQTYSELKEIAPHLFPTLEEILALDPPPLMLDIKADRPILARPQDIYFAFADTLMQTLIEQFPPENLIGLYGRDHLPLLSINHIDVTPETTGRLWAWTVDNPRRAQQLIEWGIEGLITNNIAALRKN